ncbi:flotillin family protein [Cognatishimia sp. F0-27]|uniref:flotillin family protein n=1 Tax=Cognatishimia sp. F0-27 TaxID=2816855 RepID=UPI001D0C2C8C|nr:flotillin domain-containing protein [Cognatishimia sp. F0-27]MCC1491334.1 flotillin [Cognatishimia sp. F0-27]
MSALAWIILLVIVLAVLVVLAAAFYQRASNEVALVKTGIGGRKVVIDGGTLAIPYFHEVARVNMQTIRMSVACDGERSLITQDRLRVNVEAEVYVSVKPDEDSVSRATQTLGKRLFQADQLRGLLDGMVIDALRAEAAKATMDELHENRGAFVANVQKALTDPLAKFGLEMDSVSLIGLDQTPFAALDENNAFNAVGMRKLAQVIATSRKERAEIERNSEVSVTQTAMEAAKRKLEIELEQRRAEIAQAQEIETLLATQMAEIANRKAEAERSKARARIQMEQDIQADEIASAKALRQAEIARQQDLELAEQDRLIQIAAKSQEESRAQASADVARTEAVKAAEALRTAEAMAQAERKKALALLSAEQEAESAAARARIASESDKATAKDKRAAKEEEALAMKAFELAQAEATLARINAENARSDAIVAMELEKARLESMPKIIAEMVRPAEKIKGISINHINGMGSNGAEAGSTAPVSQAINSIMDMAVQMPALKKIGDAVGVNLEDSIETVSGRKADKS